MTLEERLSSIDDVTEAEAFNEILMYAEQLKEEDEAFMAILLSKSKQMIISWEQPWYQQSNCLTRQLRHTEQMEMKSFRTDRLSKDESDKIHKNWKKLRKLFSLPKTPICLARWKNTSKSKNPNTPEEYARRFVVAFLAKGLERNLHQVYTHFTLRYGNHKKGLYSPWEVKVIDICLYHIQKHAVPFLSFILARQPRQIYKKINEKYKEAVKTEKVKWTLPLATKLVNLLIQYTGVPLKELNNKKIETSVWVKVQDEMEQHYMKLQRFWYFTLHVQLFVKCDVKRRKLRKSVFKILRNYPYKVWSDIRWKEIIKHFTNGFTTYFFYKLCCQVVSKRKDYLKTPLDELIQFALITIKKFPNKRLRTVILNDNQELEEYRYTNKNFKV